MSIQTDSRSENMRRVIVYFASSWIYSKNIETQELRAELVYSFRVIVKKSRW